MAAAAGQEDLINWFPLEEHGFFSKLSTNVLKAGPLPRHVACIVDGNRTYAKHHSIDAVKSYLCAVDVITKLLGWCRLYGIPELSVYTLSTENLKRDPRYLLRFLDLLHFVIFRIYQQLDQFKATGTRVQMMGDWTILPPCLRGVLAKLVVETRNCDRFRFNIGCMYTGRNEITRGVQQLWKAVNEKRLSPDDLCVPLLDHVISLTSAQSPVDLLIRTSGCTRVSDFMTWQSTHAILRFVPELWPDFTFWGFQKAIFFYQRQKLVMDKMKTIPAIQEFDGESAEDRVKNFVNDVEASFWNMVEREASQFNEEAGHNAKGRVLGYLKGSGD